MPIRLLATGLDALLPTAGVLVLIKTGGLPLFALSGRGHAELFVADRLLLRLYDDPGELLSTPLAWMVIWTAVALVELGSVRTTFGKWLVGLRIRQHDGSIASLEEVLDHYAAGGRTLSSGPYAGVGRDNPRKSPLVKGFPITESEKSDLVAFLKSLTDDGFVEDPRLARPSTDSAAGRRRSL